MLCGRETWCLTRLGETDLGIMRSIGITMIRSMCGVRLMERKKIRDLINMLGL